MRDENLTLEEFCKEKNIGRTKAYELINSGALRAKKIGRKTVIPRSSANEWQESLPDYLETEPDMLDGLED